MEVLINQINSIKENPRDFFIAIAVICVFYLLSSIMSKIIVRLVLYKNKDNKSKESIKNKIKNNGIYRSLSIFFKVLGVYIAIIILNLPEDWMVVITKTFKIISILLVAYAINYNLRPNSTFIKNMKEKMKDKKSDMSIRIMSKAIKVLVYFITGAIILYELGYDISRLITGLGLVGVIISLAAQDTAKNLFGGLIVVLDKAFVVGDWIEVGQVEGIVEDITFRSTKVRTFKESIVNVPNSVMSSEAITNWNKMNKRRINLNLEATLTTDLNKLKKCVQEINEALNSDPDVDKEKIYVKFDEITANGYHMLIIFYIPVTTYEKYLEVKEQTNYKVMEILKNNNIELAYDSKDIYVHNN